MHNSSGKGEGFSREAEMQAFDKLVPELRKALRESHRNWSAAKIYNLVNFNSVSTEIIIQMISEKDKVS